MCEGEKFRKSFGGNRVAPHLVRRKSAFNTSIEAPDVCFCGSWFFSPSTHGDRRSRVKTLHDRISLAGISQLPSVHQIAKVSTLHVAKSTIKNVCTQNLYDTSVKLLS